MSSSILPPPPSQAGSSSTVIYAQPSKEWKIPPKPKPGRKPKHQAIAAAPLAEISEEARKNQNRAAQRAFRERKQDQLASLQARLQSYEQGETERHVQLQALGKRLKEENDKLRNENTALKEELAKLRAENGVASTPAEPRVKLEEVDVNVTARKRTPSMTSTSTSARKRPRRESQAPFSLPLSDTVQPSQTMLSELTPRGPGSSCSAISSSLHGTNAQASSSSSSTSMSASHLAPPSAGTPSMTSISTPSSSSMASSPASIQSPHATTSLSNDFTSRTAKEVISSASGMSADASYHTHTPQVADKLSFFGPSGELQIVDCGFCSEDTPCICRELALRERDAQESRSPSPPAMDIDDLIVDKPPESFDLAPVTSSSILDNLPPYQPPVPLRKRGNGPKTSIFPLLPSNSDDSESPMCSGDPSNCGACKDDSFGRAFCSALNSACSEGKCASCPGRNRNLVEDVPTSSRALDDPPPPVTPCCENSGHCGLACNVLTRPVPMHPAPAPPIFSTIPTSSAWATLKAHPAVQHKSSPFTNLNLLADVVARRTKCLGPQVVIEPALGVPTPERARSPEGTQTEPTLGVRCSHDRVREVRAEGVEDALALLDDHLRRNTVEPED